MSQPTMTPDIATYLSGPFQTIGGWCSPWLWHAIAPIAERHAALGVRRPVAEIGVFQGKFLLGLVHTAGVPTDNHAIDVFDMQEFNLDGAGEGNLDALRQSMAKADVPPEAITVLRADSMGLSPTDVAAIMHATGGFSLFSVDGCHMVEHTINDIRLAMQLTVREGIIFVDDYTNMDWPGVHEGVAKLYLTDAPRFVPLLVMHNKLFLCHISFHAMWLAHVEAALRAIPGTHLKRIVMFGYDALNVVPNMSGSCDYLGRPAG
jgi:hypothetical protein